MYAGLDSPPPISRFRRPWSPDPYDPLPSSSHLNRYNVDDPYSVPGQYSTRPGRREASEVSVEALDLADYARTLQRHNYQPPPNAYDPYPPFPGVVRPFNSHESLSPPSLVASATGSSSQSHAPSSTRTPRSQASRRPFSLPPPSSYPTQSSYPGQRTPYTNSRPSSHGSNSHTRQDVRVAQPDSEIDIAHFPAFTRGWYGSRDNPGHAFSPPSASSPQDTAKRSPFDPGYIHEADPFSDPYSPPPSYPYRSSHGSNSRSSRDYVPWGLDGPDSDRMLDPETKDERIRMLEREFGGKGGDKDAEIQMVVGGVDETGKLITEGPKKRLALRWAQALLALLAAVSSIYVVALIKPKTPPPPAGTAAAYVLYVLSIITFLLVSYLFLIYPCCCGRRKPKTPFTEGPSGMMVLPVAGPPGKQKHKKGKKGKGGPGEGVQVNLIVDPSMFGGGRDRDREGDSDDDGASEVPGSWTTSSGGGARRPRGPKRRSIFAGLAMEEQWKRARKMLKWGAAVDVLAMVLWGIEFVLILLGKRCPVGGFQGWCDGYNLATASACLLCFAFAFSTFFDVKDLHASRASPRTRT